MHLQSHFASSGKLFVSLREAVYLVLDITLSTREVFRMSLNRQHLQLFLLHSHKAGTYFTLQNIPLSIIYRSGKLEMRQNSDVSVLQAGPLNTTQLLKLALQAVVNLSHIVRSKLALTR